MTQHQAPEVTSELRECPNELCDYSRPHLNETDADLNATHTWVSCENCGACGPRIENPSQYFGRTEHWDEVKAEAITAWNTRATQPLSLTVDYGLIAQQTSAWLRQCSDWLLSNDLDMQCPMETDPLDLADALDRLQSLSLPDSSLQKAQTSVGDIDRSGLAQEVE